MPRTLFALILLLIPLTTLRAEPLTLTADQTTLTLDRGVAIQGLARRGRSAIGTDPLAAARIAGDLANPAPGDTFDNQGTPVPFTAVTANPDGWFGERSLVGGTLFITIDSQTPRTMLLSASGHTRLLVNGTPRTGDPYEYGWLTTPIQLQQGLNELAFTLRRGRLRASLTAPTADLALLNQDIIWPDALTQQPPTPHHAGVVALNTTPAPITATITASSGDASASTTATLPANSATKVAITLPPLSRNEPGELPITLAIAADGATATEPISKPLKFVGPTDQRSVTFISNIDASAQYYALRPATWDGTGQPPGITTSLHGAGVEASHQASFYRKHDWTHLIAPTNRRPFGFDWEDWGRLDALECLDHAQSTLLHDPTRLWLTGHSMGGHGTLQLGVLFPDKFAAIAPSAGWVSFWTYGGGAPWAPDASPHERALYAATLSSRTLEMRDNLANRAVYILHGDSDETVPVSQARTMRAELAQFHTDFAYYERRGAGHWWGGQCMDWPPIFDLFKERATNPNPDRITFVTPSPAVSPTSHWATIEQTIDPALPARIDLAINRETNTLTGSTTNVARLAINLPSDSLKINLTGDHPLTTTLTKPQDAPFALQLIGDPDAPLAKSPSRTGPFKHAFNNRALLVIPTGGDDATNQAWANRARYDAESFWYRGNASFQIITDRQLIAEHLATGEPFAQGRNLILFGDASINGAWSTVLQGAPVDIRPGKAVIGDTTHTGTDLAALFCWPRADDPTAMVGVVAATGPQGLALTAELPYFVSGAGFPDLLLLDTTSLTTGIQGVREALFFQNNWALPPQ